MSGEKGDVRRVFTTAEVAIQVGLNAAYLLRLVKRMKFDETEMRQIGPKGYLFSAGAIEKIKQRPMAGQ